MFPVARSSSTKTGRAPLVDDGIRRYAEGHGRGDDLVAGPDPGGEQREMEGGRARAQRDRVPSPDVLTEDLLEACHPGPRADPSGAERRHDLGDLLLSDRRATEDERVLARTRRSGRPTCRLEGPGFWLTQRFWPRNRNPMAATY
jgi:hypothetical protein